jgi:glycine betaine/choline ABC-type transport system substrate-binding protein
VSIEVLEENPEMEGIRELNDRANIAQEDPEDVAEEFVREQGLI